jgi:hypothetical protein
MERTLSKRNEFILATFATLVFLPSIALADEAPAPCVTSTLSDYIAAGSAGCTFGGLAFSNFSYSSLQTSQFPASSATVIPVMGSHGVGFEFRSTWGCDVPEHENSCGFFDGTITYTVTGASINGQRLNFFESSPAMISDASVRETTQRGAFVRLRLRSWPQRALDGLGHLQSHGTASRFKHNRRN